MIYDSLLHCTMSGRKESGASEQIVRFFFLASWIGWVRRTRSSFSDHHHHHHHNERPGPNVARETFLFSVSGRRAFGFFGMG